VKKSVIRGKPSSFTRLLEDASQRLVRLWQKAPPEPPISSQLLTGYRETTSSALQGLDQRRYWGVSASGHARDGGVRIMSAAGNTGPQSPLATATAGIGRNNPILVQILGICSALAVTNAVKPTLVMGTALILVTACSNLVVSLLRTTMPHRVRLMAQMLVISVLVIVVHLCLRAYYFEMSERLGPYVGLIITNCIVLGRTEAYAMHHGPGLSFLDGMGTAAGYALVLLLISLVREPLGSGTLLGLSVVPSTFKPALVLNAAPGAFVTLGVLVWIVRSIWPQKEQTEHPESLK
jgi:Na+-transporting NADH:ubiquinone oxidoreductase subunit D